MKLMNLKGTFDFLPSDQVIRNKIINTLRTNFEKYGYLPLETPILNYYDLLAYKYDSDAEILSEIYKLKDQGDRNLGLRYDLTVPFCKVIGMTKDLRLPFRRYEIGKVFRNGPVKLGRTREFYQCDVDVVGIDNRLIEAEQILMGINTYKDLGIDVLVKYNNRKLMSGLIKEAGISEEKVTSVIGAIDKLEKITREELIENLENLGLDNIVINNLLELFEYSFNDYEEKFKDTTNQDIKDGLEELLELNTYLSNLGIIDSCKFTPTLARGLTIYTGVVFEFYDKQLRLTCALGAGGRYNKIITDFMDNGTLYPAIGFSFGLEPIYTILKGEATKNSLIDIYLVPLDTNIETLKIATALREEGYKVLVEMNKKKVGKCFEYAEHENIKFISIIGSNEVETQVISVKNMTTKEENQIKINELSNFLKNNIDK
ncbi:MAG: histidine--tRNA ligase [Bacilli bacterium]|nr:histidine--tRNA ligase [Bacilli bacterium]